MSYDKVLLKGSPVMALYSSKWFVYPTKGPFVKLLQE